MAWASIEQLASVKFSRFAQVALRDFAARGIAGIPDTDRSPMTIWLVASRFAGLAYAAMGVASQRSEHFPDVVVETQDVGAARDALCPGLWPFF